MDQTWHFVKTTHKTALTGPNSDAVRDADAVVDDGEHVDVVLHAGVQACDGAGCGIAWNSYLELHACHRDRYKDTRIHGCTQEKKHRKAVNQLKAKLQPSWLWVASVALYFTSWAAWCVGHQEISQPRRALPLQVNSAISHPSDHQVHDRCHCWHRNKQKKHWYWFVCCLSQHQS